MKQKVQAIEYDANYEILETKDDFEFVEDAQKWCEARRGEPIEWGDTEFGYSGMTAKEQEHLGEHSEFPPRMYEVHGIEEDGGIRYLEDEDYKERT
jgi:hypothetical protein